MNANYIPTFPSHPFPVGDYRAIVTDCRADEITDGIVTVYLYLLLFDLQTNHIYTYCDSLVNHSDNPRSMEFFDFLSASYVCWEDYDDLIGLTFDTSIAYEQYGDTVMPILCNRKLLAKPPCR